MYGIIYKRLDANHKLIFRKFEKEIKVCNNNNNNFIETRLQDKIFE